MSLPRDEGQLRILFVVAGLNKLWPELQSGAYCRIRQERPPGRRGPGRQRTQER